MNKIYTRKVTIEDKKIIWEWWNDPITRKMMKVNEVVPWETHIKWFEDTLSSESRILLVTIINDEKAGVVRFDLKDNRSYEVSINLNPKFRGKGYGSKILNKSINLFLKNHNSKKLFAKFKKQNIASRNTFIANQFIINQNPNLREKGMEDFEILNEEYCELILKNEEKEC